MIELSAPEKMNLLSRPEELLLLAVWRLQDEAYGAAILDHLSEATGEDWSIGSVYSPLNRLAARGYLTTYMGEPTPERGGRSKRYFKLTAEGVAALNHVNAIHERMWTGLPSPSIGTAR